MRDGGRERERESNSLQSGELDQTACAAPAVSLVVQTALVQAYRLESGLLLTYS